MKTPSRRMWRGPAAAILCLAAVQAQQRLPLTAADAAAGDRFGSGVSLAAGTVLVGAPLADLPAIADAGAAYVFTLSGSTATQQAKLTAADATVGAQFGNRVEIVGDVAVIGAWNDDPVPGSPDAGSVYVFARMGTVWLQQQKLLAGDIQAGAHLGACLAFDGTRIAVGAPDCDQGRGAVYAYELLAGNWVQVQKVTGNGIAPNDRFGSSVSLSHPTLAVGASQRDVAGKRDSGSFHAFDHGPGGWVESYAGTTNGAYTGRAIAIAGDSLLVSRTGSVNTFVRVGGSWRTGEEIQAPGLQEVLLDNVAVSTCHAVVGAPSSSGSVTVFRRREQPKLEQMARHTNDPGQGGGQFGFSVAIDGTDYAVGAPLNDLPGKPDAGMAYVFRTSGCAQEAWNLVHGGSGAPGGREQHAMASDTRRSRVVMFGGGSGNGHLGDTWEWNGTAWSQRATGQAPPPRSGHAMVYDPVGQRVVLYGGQSTSAPGGFADMWQWDGAAWTPISNSGAARGPVVSGTMTWDLHRTRAVLFGGAGAQSNDTWEWQRTGTTSGQWTRLPTAAGTHPGFRYYHAAAYDQARRVTLVQGGRDAGGIPYADTWAWDGVAWTMVANGPPLLATIYHSMAYDVASTKVVMNCPGMPFTWTWDGRAWTQRVADNGPRWRSAMVWDQAQRRLIMFSGGDENVGGVYLDDTWAWCGCGN